jgi:N-acetylglucosamine-6-sulfatase
MRRQGRRIPRGIAAFRKRLLLPVFAALGVTGALAIASGTHPATLGEAAASQARPNIVVIETDDQTLASMRVMENVNSLIGGHGTTFKNSFVNYSLCCPSRATFLTGQYMHNHRVFSNQAPNGGFGRFQELHGNNNLAVWLQHAGYYTALIGKYLNEYANDPPVPAGWSEWHVAPEGYGVYISPMNENGTLVYYGQDPADFKQDVLTL